MSRGFRTFGSVLLAVTSVATILTSSARPQDSKDSKAMTELAGVWHITYTNGSVRHYTIDKQGSTKFEQENRQGRAIRKSEANLLYFAGDTRMERLTLGIDGRLFVEHFAQQADLVGKSAEIMGVGIRQK